MSLTHTSSLTPFSICCFQLIQVWGRGWEDMIRSKNGSLTVDPTCLPEIVDAWATFVGSSETPLLYGESQLKFPGCRTSNWLLTTSRRSIPFLGSRLSSKWSSWTDYLSRTNGASPFPGETRENCSSSWLVRTAPLSAGVEVAHKTVTLPRLFLAWVFKHLCLPQTLRETDQYLDTEAFSLALRRGEPLTRSLGQVSGVNR